MFSRFDIVINRGEIAAQVRQLPRRNKGIPIVYLALRRRREVCIKGMNTEVDVFRQPHGSVRVSRGCPKMCLINFRHLEFSPLLTI